MNVKTTLEWREKHAHLCKAAAMDPPQTLPNHARMCELSVCGARARPQSSPA